MKNAYHTLYLKVVRDSEDDQCPSVKKKKDLSGCSPIDCTQTTQSYLCKITTMLIQVLIIYRHLKVRFSKSQAFPLLIISDND